MKKIMKISNPKFEKLDDVGMNMISGGMVTLPGVTVIYNKTTKEQRTQMDSPEMYDGAALTQDEFSY